MKDQLNKYFQLEKRGTNIKTEFLAGMTTFLAMAYILSVNSGMLSDVGMHKESVFAATAIAAIVGTLIMGLVANYPVALAPGMGMNAFFAYTLISASGYGYSPRLALTAVFISGIIFLLISVTSLREKVINAIPQDLKYAVGAGIGLFIAFLGFQNADIIVGDVATKVTLGSLAHPGTLLAVVGLIITSILYIKKVPAAVFFGLVITAIIGFIAHPIASHFGVDPELLKALPALPETFFQLPQFKHFGDFAKGFADGKWGDIQFLVNFVVIIFTLLFLDFFDTAGTLVSVGSHCGLINEDGELQDSAKALSADAISTVVGAAMGTSTTTSFVESLSGVGVGGRTGLTAVFTGIGFIVALFFGPIFTAVTFAVTAPALIFVGILMAVQFGKIAWDDFEIAIPAFLTIIIMPLAYSIAHGIAVGFIFYPITMLAAKRGKEVSKIMYGLSIVFVIYFAITAIDLSKFFG